MKKNEFFEYLPNFVKDTKDLTLGSKNVLAALLFLSNNEYSKENGFFYRSNKDLCKDAEVCEHTLIKSLSQLEVMGFIGRKVGKRGTGASEYKINESFLNSLKVDFNKIFGNAVNEERIKVEGFTAKCSKECSNKSAVIENKKCSNQNPNKQRGFEESAVISAVKKCSTDTESDKETDIEIELNKNIKILIKKIEELINILPEPEEIKEKEKNIINYIQKEKESSEPENKFEDEEEKIIEDKNKTQTPLEGFALKKEEINLEQTPTVEIEKPVEKEIINNFNVETAVINNNNKTSVEMEIITPTNESAVQYKFMHYDEQLEKFNILITKLKKCTSAEELTHKHSLMQKYMREHTFLISFLDKAQRTYRELIKNFETPTEKPNKDAVSPSDELDGIIFSPTDFNALEPSTEKEKEKNSAKREREETNEAKLSPTSPSNDEGGITTHQEENNATGAKKTALETKREERLKNLNELIDTIETLSDFKFVQKRVNASWDVLTTEDIAELTEKLTYKAITL